MFILNSIVRISIQRFFELLIIEITLSVMSMLFNLSDLTKTQAGLVISMSLCVMVFIIINVMFLRECFLYLESRNAYYKANLIAYTAFVTISLVTYFFSGNVAHTWLFSITKFVAYSAQNVSGLASLIIFHLIMIATIFVAPWDMYLDKRLNRP